MKRVKKNWRIWMISFIFIVSLIGILVRLFLIQVVSTRAFSDSKVDLVAMAQENHHREMVIDTGRGAILDRNGKPLVGLRGWRILAFPQMREQLKLKQAQLEQLATTIAYPLDKLVAQLQEIRQPSFLVNKDGVDFEINPLSKGKIESLRIPGIFVVEADKRMTSNQIGFQTIGRLARNPFIVKARYPDEVDHGLSQQVRVGISGIEASFDPFLHGKEENTLVYTKDRFGRPLNGIQVKATEKEWFHDMPPYTVVTTIDQDIQRQVEMILKDEKVQDGSVVVQDISSGDLLTVASRPSNMDSLQGNPWDNRAFMEMTPGSIFKIVVAVGALEEGIVTPNTIFKCTGDLKRYHMKDAHLKGHGSITFATAFAQSCNITLSQVAEKLGGKRIEEYAKRLGLGQEVMWKGHLFKEKKFHQIFEQSGVIFSDPSTKHDLGAVAQTGIGQRDVKVTPVQAVNMVTSLFHQGRTLSPRIVTALKGEEGKVAAHFNLHRLETRAFKGSTIRAMRRMMREVVTEGTAKSLSYSPLILAGKTGTAQISNNLYNKWMIGYGSSYTPHYAVAVVLRDVSDWKDPRATRIFKKVMEVTKRVKR